MSEDSPITDTYSSPCSYSDEDNQQSLSELLHQVKQVQELAQSLQLRQQLLTNFLTPASQSSVSLEAQLIPSGFDLVDASSALEIRNNSFNSSIQFFSGDQLGNQPASEVASSTHQELLDLLDIFHSDQELPCTVVDEAKNFKESLFIPFAIKDANKVTSFCILSLSVFLLNSLLSSPSRSLSSSSPSSIGIAS